MRLRTTALAGSLLSVTLAAGLLSPATATVQDDGVTAAATFNWGTPLPQSDEFGYTGAPDGAKWSQAGECWPGHAGNGRRCASRSNVANGVLTQTGLANGANDVRQCIQCMPSGHLTIQLDNFSGDNLQPAAYDIDWVRIYDV